MDKNKKTQKQAVSALIQEPVTQAMDLEGLVDTLKQMYHTQRGQAEHAQEIGSISRARIHFEAAAVIADLLSTYYQTTNTTVAPEWAQRAIRLHSRAVQIRNIRAENIGATER